LVELIANFNQLEVWPSDFGFQLVNLQKLYLHLNKITGLPSSIGELRSLKVLDIHFNKLRSLPAAIGNLLNLEMLDVSSNFNDLTTLPDSIGDLVSLLDLDLSFNQIHELPISIGRLTNLRRLKLEENPLTIPPMEIVQQGEEAVIAYMSECWKESLRTDEEKTLTDSGDTAHTENSEGWLPTWAGGALLNNWFGKMWTGGVTDMLGAKTWGPKKSEDDAFLDQQL
jgi:Leucine-rich repeat (LRR) protein